MRQVRSNNKMMNKQSSFLTVAPLLVLLLLWVLTAPACVPPYRVDVHYSLIDSFINSFIPGGSSSTIPADHSQVNSIETTTMMGLSTSVLLTWSPFVQVLTMVLTGVLSLAVIRTASIAIDLGGTQATMMNHSLACRLLACDLVLFVRLREMDGWRSFYKEDTSFCCWGGNSSPSSASFAKIDEWSWRLKCHQ